MAASVPLKEPLIIVGTGRSGSTLLHELLSLHPRVTWLSGLASRFPRRPRISQTLMRALAVPGARALLPSRVRPSEHYPFWEEYAKGFTHTFRDLVAADATPFQVRQLRQAFGRILTPGRPQLVLKITGWPRIGFLRQVFPDAKFLHIVRDGRAVASSLLAVKFWKGWEGPERWGFGPLDPEQQRLWDAHGRSFQALAAIEWNLLLDAMREASNGLDDQHFMEMRYEDLCADVTGSVQEIARFAELAWTPRFERVLAARPVESANAKWQRDLTKEQQRIITEIERPWLAHYGYLSADVPVAGAAADRGPRL